MKELFSIRSKLQSFHTTTFSTENLLAIDMKKTQIFKNKHVYLGYKY